VPDSQQKYYDAVAEEIINRKLKRGLWARAIAEAGCEGAPARAVYIRLRVSELVEEEGQRSGSDTAQSLREPAGVGGWLLLFCVGLTIIGPLWSVLQMIDGYHKSAAAFVIYPELQHALAIENICIGGLLVYGFVTGARIWAGSPNGLKLARRYLVIRLIGFLFTKMISYWLMSGLHAVADELLMKSVLGALLREGLHFIIWWSYFARSERVRNTYRILKDG
jgi:hypothetical protein